MSEVQVTECERAMRQGHTGGGTAQLLCVQREDDFPSGSAQSWAGGSQVI